MSSVGNLNTGMAPWPVSRTSVMRVSTAALLVAGCRRSCRGCGSGTASTTPTVPPTAGPKVDQWLVSGHQGVFERSIHERDPPFDRGGWDRNVAPYLVENGRRPAGLIQVVLSQSAQKVTQRVGDQLSVPGRPERSPRPDRRRGHRRCVSGRPAWTGESLPGHHSGLPQVFRVPAEQVGQLGQ